VRVLSVVIIASGLALDITVNGYTHVAYEGGSDSAEYSAIEQWIKRIQSHSNYVAME
jgi:glutathione S-transferase